MNAKVMGLVFIVSAVSLFSGFIMFQTLTNNGSSSLPEENLELANQHVWYDQRGWAEAAIVVVNLGERNAVLRKIAVRSIESKWSDVYYWKTDTGPISNKLTQTSTELSSSSFDILVDGKQRTFQQSVNEITLGSGWTVVLYIKSPGNITSTDANHEITISIFSESKLYYKQASVDFSYTFMKTEELKVQSHTWAVSRTSISLTVKNTGTDTLTIREVRVNDVTVSNVTYTSGSATLQAGGSATLRVAPTSGSTFTAGVKYEFAMVTATGNKYTYVATAP